MFQDFFVSEGGGPAVGVEDRVIQRRMDVVQFLDLLAGDGAAGYFVELRLHEVIARLPGGGLDRLPVVDEAVVQVSQGALLQHFFVGVAHTGV